MFREMAEGSPDYPAWWLTSRSAVLKNYGYDRDMVERGIKKGRKLILKDEYAKERQKDLRAALGLGWL